MSSNKPFPSSDLDVFKENSLILDNFVNSQENEHPDRFGRKRPTITGIIKEAFNVRTDISNMNETLIGQSRWDVVPKNTSLSLGGDNGALNKQAQALFNRTVMLKVHTREALRRTYQEVGLVLVPGSFEDGGVLETITDVLLEEKTGKVYSWTGSFPKVVAKGTSPTSEIEFLEQNIKSLYGMLSRTFDNDGIVFNTVELENTSLPIGTTIRVDGRYGGRFKIIPRGSKIPDGYFLLSVGGDKLAELQFSNILKPEWFGVFSNTPGTLESETADGLNAMFSALKNKTGLVFELNGVYYVNKQITVPFCETTSPHILRIFTISGKNSIIASSHQEKTLVIKTSSDIGQRNYGFSVEDLTLRNTVGWVKGTGLYIEGSFSPIFSRVFCHNFDKCFEIYCSSEVIFDKCVATTCNYGVYGDQLANPNGVNGNDYSVITYNQFVCFGFEKCAIRSNGGGSAKHIGGTMASPGLAARSFIQYQGSIRDVVIEDVLLECQNVTLDGCISFLGNGLKRSIKISGVVQEVISSPNNVLIRADGVENITIENIPFTVQGDVFEHIKYVRIDGAKVVSFINNARSYNYLNKVDLYDVEEVFVDGYNFIEINPQSTIRYTTTGEPVGIYTLNSYQPGELLDHTGKAGFKCSTVYNRLHFSELMAFLASKKPMISCAKVLTLSDALGVKLVNGNVNKGQYTYGCIPGRWKTQFFVLPTSGLTVVDSSVNGPVYFNIAGCSGVYMLTQENFYNPQIAIPESELNNITGWPVYKTLYNSDTTPNTPIGWVNTYGGKKAIKI
ncbi:putative tailspike protein [Aeromonas phage AVP1]|nr:putative tailspike protein [Aeromonas phage AVP1]